MTEIPSFELYLTTLGRLSSHVDPTAGTAEAAEIRQGAASLGALSAVDIDTLVTWIREHPSWVPVLGLAAGLSREKLRNTLRHAFDTSGWTTLARDRPDELIQLLDEEFDIVRLVNVQRNRTYDFGDLLVARAGTRATATRAGESGRHLEDEIEVIVGDLGLTYQTRTRFRGRNGRTAPCDLVIPDGADADIVVAAKGFDSTGSKLTDAVREILDMADVRLPRQFVIAVIDGIGWKSRQADLRRIHALWGARQIDGMYTLATLGDFRADLERAARLRGYL